MKTLISLQIFLLVVKFFVRQDLHWAIVLSPTAVFAAAVFVIAVLLLTFTISKRKDKSSRTRTAKIGEMET